MDTTTEQLKQAGMTLSAIVSGLLIALMTCALFFSGPTGKYYLNTSHYTQGAIGVYEHVRFGPDNRVFTGAPDRALRIYLNLSKPPIPRFDGIIAP